MLRKTSGEVSNLQGTSRIPSCQWYAEDSIVSEAWSLKEVRLSCLKPVALFILCMPVMCRLTNSGAVGLQSLPPEEHQNPFDLPGPAPGRQKQADVCDLEASLVSNLASYRTVMAPKKLCLEKTTNKETTDCPLRFPHTYRSFNLCWFCRLPRIQRRSSGCESIPRQKSPMFLRHQHFSVWMCIRTVVKTFNSLWT